MCIPFTIFYLETPLSALLQALNKNRLMFAISIIQCTLEIVLIYFLSQSLGVFSIAVSMLIGIVVALFINCLLYTSPSPRDRQKSRMPSSA